MFKNHLSIAFRNIVKKKGYALLHIAGLTVGMSCCLLIFHYVSYERSYDTFEPAHKQIVRVRLDVYQKGELAYKSATSYPPIGPTMKKDFPEVENFCRLIDGGFLLSNEAGNKKFSEDKSYYADAAAINMFNLQFIEGNPQTALSGPDKIILSQSTARKYFGKEKALGKTLISRGRSHSELFEVTGVYKDFPANSHLILQCLVSYSTLGKQMAAEGSTGNATETAWGWYDFYVYLQLKANINYKQLEAKLPAFTEKYINTQGFNTANNKRVELHLIPLSDIYLYSSYNQEAEVNGNGQAVSFLFLIALFIICIAWINYINLATARSVERAKEVGVRKVLGALRSSLVRQFLTESFLVNFISLLFSLLIFFILLRPFDVFTGRDIYTGVALTFNYWLLFIGLFISGTLLSGIYPAFALSGFKPVIVLKGAFKNTTSGLLLRKSLIVIQFATSVVLIAGTVIVYQQVSYMRNKSLGANINQTLVLKGPQTIADSIYQNTYQPFKSTVLQQPDIKSITASSDVPGNEIYWTRGVKRLGDNGEAVTLYNLGVDYNFIHAYDIKISAGRNFSEQFGTDKKTAIINENAATLLGFKDAATAVGEKIIRQNDTLTIVGVTANFHQMGLQKNIDPIILLPDQNISAFYSLKINQSNMQQTIASLKQTWDAYFPKDPFNYFFLDESFGQQYKADILFGKVFGVFAFLAILIACFGLLGLSAYNVLQRTKEIGIRKVLGASVANVTAMLSKDFIKLVLIAVVIATPIAWLAMNEWLQNFAYRTSISWWIFALAAIITLVIALVTVSFQAVKAAVANPIRSLRTE